MSKYKVHVPEYEAIWYLVEVEAETADEAVIIATKVFKAAEEAAANGDTDEDGETQWSKLADYDYSVSDNSGVRWDEIRVHPNK